MTVDTHSALPQGPPIQYAPPPGPPPQQYLPPPGPPPPPPSTHHQWQPHPAADYPLLSPFHICSLMSRGYTTFPIAYCPALYDAATSLFNASRTFFAQPQAIKAQFQIRKANAQGSEEGWSRVEGEKELLTLRREGAAACPLVVEDRGKAVWQECGALLRDVIRGVEENLGMPKGVMDHIVVPECAMPEAGAERVETLLRMFRYERRSEQVPTAATDKGRLVSEPHRDLGLLSLVIGASPGLEVFDTTNERWIPIEQPPYAESAGRQLTATLLVGETLTCLTNGFYASGRHRVFVPAIDDAAREDDSDSQHYRYSLVFALRPHPHAVISTAPLTTTVTGPFSYPLVDVRGRELFAAIAQSHWNVNTDRKAREVQKSRLKKTVANGNHQQNQHQQGAAAGASESESAYNTTVSRTLAERKHRWSLTMFGSSRVREEDVSPEGRRRRWSFFKRVS